MRSIARGARVRKLGFVEDVRDKIGNLRANSGRVRAENQQALKPRGLIVHLHYHRRLAYH